MCVGAFGRFGLAAMAFASMAQASVEEIPRVSRNGTSTPASVSASAGTTMAPPAVMHSSSSSSTTKTKGGSHGDFTPITIDERGVPTTLTTSSSQASTSHDATITVVGTQAIGSDASLSPASTLREVTITVVGTRSVASKDEALHYTTFVTKVHVPAHNGSHIHHHTKTPAGGHMPTLQAYEANLALPARNAEVDDAQRVCVADTACHTTRHKYAGAQSSTMSTPEATPSPSKHHSHSKASPTLVSMSTPKIETPAALVAVHPPPEPTPPNKSCDVDSECPQSVGLGPQY